MAKKKIAARRCRRLTQIEAERMVLEEDVDTLAFRWRQHAKAIGDHMDTRTHVPNAVAAILEKLGEVLRDDSVDTYLVLARTFCEFSDRHEREQVRGQHLPDEIRAQCAAAQHTIADQEFYRALLRREKPQTPSNVIDFAAWRAKAGR